MDDEEFREGEALVAFFWVSVAGIVFWAALIGATYLATLPPK